MNNISDEKGRGEAVKVIIWNINSSPYGAIRGKLIWYPGSLLQVL